MTIQQILREKNLSRYQLSKKSGVPWATLADICSGKTTLSRCSAGTLMKLSSTLDIPMEQLITLTVEKPQMHGGKPADRTYLEKDLPASLDKALREYIQGEKDKVSYMDCLWGCLLYTSDAADDLLCVDLCGRRIIKKKKNEVSSRTITGQTNDNNVTY